MIISVKKPYEKECRAIPGRYDDVLDVTVYATCCGRDCAHFRLLPHMCDAEWLTVVKKVAVQIGDTSPNRGKAVAEVNANRAKYGLPTEPAIGFCGLAGKPEVLL